MILLSSCSCLCPIHWSQVLSREWRCSWSSADRRCPNYIWLINNLIAYQSASYIRDLTVYLDQHSPDGTKPLPQPIMTCHPRCSVKFISEEFQRKCSWTCAQRLHFQNDYFISQEPTSSHQLWLKQCQIISRDIMSTAMKQAKICQMASQYTFRTWTSTL